MLACFIALCRNTSMSLAYMIRLRGTYASRMALHKVYPSRGMHDTSGVRYLYSPSQAAIDRKPGFILLDEAKSPAAYSEAIESYVGTVIRDYCGADNPWMLLMVSGGSDSMAMLHIMKSVKERIHPNMLLEVASFDHGMREESSIEVGVT